MAMTTTTQVDPAVAIFYDRVLLTRAVPYLVHTLFAQKKHIPKKRGNTMKFRRYASLSPATTPLTEGTTPASAQLSKTDITAQVSWYGNYVEITDVIDLTVEDPVLTEAAEILGENMGETLDQLTRDVLAACASYTNASHGSNGNTPTEITKADIDAVVKTLLTNKAKMITPLIRASTGIGTAPVRRAYWGIISTDLINDLEAVSNFKSVAEYPGNPRTDEFEWGATGNVRWVITQNGYSTGASPDVYYLPILGKDAYGVVDIEGAQAKNIVKDFGSAGTADPLNQRATSGWKCPFVAKILNDNFMNILRVTAA